MTNTRLGQILLAILVLLLGADLLGQLFRRLRQPKVVGEILAGMPLGPTVLGEVASGFAAAIFGSDRWVVGVRVRADLGRAGDPAGDRLRKW